MIPRCVIGKGVTGACYYVLGEGRGAGNDNLAPGEESRIAWIGGQNFGFRIKDRDDADLARRVMEFDALNQASRTKQCEKDAVHLVLAWRTGEAPTQEQMEEAARGALKALGMENAKAIWAAHRDEAYAHLHIVASKINPETGYAYDMRRNYLKLSKWAEQYEREHGGIVCIRREEASGLRDAIDRRDGAAVLEAMTRRRATFTAADLERALGKQILGELVRVQFGNSVLDHPEVVRLADRAEGPTARYSTKTVVEAERYVLRAADLLSRNDRHGLPYLTVADIADRLRDEGKALGPDQLAALDHATRADGLALVDGQAGSGKSHTMSAIRQAYEAEGYRVIGTSWTNAVVQDMKADGFAEANTVKSELMRLANGRESWNARTVIMVDEAAMIDTTHLALLAAHAEEAGAKLILVGDDRQLSSIDRGGMFGALKDVHGAAALSEPRRHYKEEDRRAASMMAEGNFADALGIFDAKGAIHWTRTQAEAREGLVEQWAKDSAAAPDKSRFVFAYTNADVAQLNVEIRDLRRKRGELGQDHELETADGQVAFASGDRIQFTGTDKKRGLHNGAAGTVTSIDGMIVTVRLDGRQHRGVAFDATEFTTFRHGYAGTIYKGQGRTLDQTYLYHSEHWRSAASYVALTRHRDKAELFVATNTARDVTELARQMARVDNRRAASQFYQLGQGTGPVRPLTAKELLTKLSGTGIEGQSIGAATSATTRDRVGATAATGSTGKPERQPSASNSRTAEEIKIRHPGRAAAGGARAAAGVAQVVASLFDPIATAVESLFGADNRADPDAAEPAKSPSRAEPAEDVTRVPEDERARRLQALSLQHRRTVANEQDAEVEEQRKRDQGRSR